MMTKKLVANDVIAIRDSGDSTRVLAARFGVSPAAISNVQRMKTWKHINRSDKHERQEHIEAPDGRQEQGRQVEPGGETSRQDGQDKPGKHREKMRHEISADDMQSLRFGRG